MIEAVRKTAIHSAICFNRRNFEEIEKLLEVEIDPENPTVIFQSVMGEQKLELGDWLVKDFLGDLVYLNAQQFHEAFERHL